MRVERGVPVSVARWLTAIMALLVAGISLLAFVLSFKILSDLAARAGIPADIAWAWPVIVDGSIVTAMLVIFAWRGRPRQATVWPWVTLLFFAAVSIVGNGVHTAVVYDATQGLTLWFAILMGAIPPVGLLLSSEMLVRLLTPTDAVVVELAPPVTAAGATVATVAPDPDSDEFVVADIPGEAPAGDTVLTDLPEAVLAAIATHETGMASVASLTQSQAVEPIPSDPAGQVEWIVGRAQAGHDVTREALMQVFEEAGQPVSDRTLQRRIASVRDLAPGLLQANA